VGVSPFGCRKYVLGYRPIHPSTEALEQLHRDRALTLAHQSEARTADVPNRIPELECAKPLKPRWQVGHTKPAESVRLAPPLTVAKAELDEGIEIMDAAFRQSL